MYQFVRHKQRFHRPNAFSFTYRVSIDIRRFQIPLMLWFTFGYASCRNDNFFLFPVSCVVFFVSLNFLLYHYHILYFRLVKEFTVNVLLNFVAQDREHLDLKTLQFFGASWLPSCIFITWL